MAERPRVPERVTVPAHVLWEVLDEALTHVVRILAAVSCCMTIVIVTVNLNPLFVENQGATLPYTPLPDTDEEVALTRATNAAANAFMLLGMIIVMTAFMVALYYYRFYSIIAAWITLACALILVMSPITYIDLIFNTYNVPADIFSVGFFVYNFMVLGLIVILSKGPLLVQQSYLVVESSFMALILIKLLPAWTLWVVLCLIPIWDLVAVLAVIGPLRILVETAKERKEGLQPGLVFATIVAGTFPGMTKRERKLPGPSPGRRGVERRPSDRRLSGIPEEPEEIRRRPSAAERPDHEWQPALEELSPPPRAAEGVPPDQDAPAQVKKPAPEQPADEDTSSMGMEEEENPGIKMGLGDFVFYSVLVGKVSTFGDWTIVCACFVGVLVGICVTLFLLAVTQSALPALPVSLAFGLTFVGFQQLIQNFMNEVFDARTFI